ncbi:MAG: UvrD-helicase domain-containing protein, partial [Lachnospiraceae bacterium]|nr:UvrD-helicase domain-containing protein [Lachnospiraceae bacterium]
GDPGFFRAVECYSKAGSDKGIANMVIPIYDFIMADPDPEGFLKKCSSLYELSSFDEFAASPLIQLLNERITKQLDKAKAAAGSAYDIIGAHEELEPYRSTIDAYKCILDRVKEAAGSGDKFFADSVRDCFRGFSHPRIASLRLGKFDDDIKQGAEEVKQLRDVIKSAVGKISDLLPFEMETCFEHVISAKSELCALTKLVTAFKRIYDAKKRDKGIIDFNDMEQMAIKILQNPDIAAIYREHFIEIYVDEYQDSNLTQEKLVSLICRHDPGNVFQVGDVKQSIYKFRHARPELFLSKYRTYTDDPSPNRRILLNDNFRCRRQTVDAVNEVFGKIMKEELGGIGYKEEAKRKFGAAYYNNDSPCDDDTYRAQLIIGTAPEKGESTDLSKDEFCANIIANRITSMIRSGFLIYDKNTETTRPVSFGDFAILARSVKSIEAVFREVFAGAGIPLAVSGREGYFTTVEVQTALAFLQTVDNPLCDIPLATLMRSPVGGFSDMDLAVLKTLVPDAKSLYDTVRSAAGTEAGEGPETSTASEDCTDCGELRNKCTALLRMLSRYREMSYYTPVHGILASFIDNEYGDHVKCMSKSRQRMANLSMLQVMAENYGRTSFKGLYQFVRYIDQMRKYSIDEGEAGVAAENAEAVRLMTIHSSKGLEFPVCFIAGMEKRRNTSDESGRLIYSAEYGFGSDFTDLDRRITGTTLPKILIKEANRLEGIAEEIRLLYVAMTRARDKLIMTGYAGEDFFEGPVKDTEDCTSYLDLIKSAMTDGGFKNIDTVFIKESDVIEGRAIEELERESVADELLSIVREHVRNKGVPADPGDLPEYLRHVSFKYPYPLNPDLRAKLSVSDLKHRAIEEEIARGLELAPEGEQLFAETEPEKYIPKFMRSEGQNEKGGTFYGSAFHRIMELWDYSKMHVREEEASATKEGDPENSETATFSVTAEDVRAFADKMYGLRRMSRDQVDAIRADDVAHFLNSALGTRMKKASDARKLYREQPFVIGMPEDGETILVQGIVDAYFIEDDGITIVDYKTDRVSD